MIPTMQSHIIRCIFTYRKRGMADGITGLISRLRQISRMQNIFCNLQMRQVFTFPCWIYFPNHYEL